MLAKRKTGWVGFDIGATSVKAAQLVRADGEYRIRSAAIVPRSPRWVGAAFAEDRPLSSADEISAAASLCDRLTGADAASLLPVALCEVLQMDAPVAKRTAAPPDLRKAVEAETHRPMQDRVFDYWPVDRQASKLNVVTAPRAWSDQIAGDVAASGWQCRVLDALPWALARAAAMVKTTETDHPIAALDWGYGKTTICLVQHGAPTLVRSLKDCAFQNVVDAVAAGLRLDEHDAETVLQKHCLDSRDGAGRGSAGVIEDLLERPLSRLVHELRRTLDYWRGVTRGQVPESIYIFGGGGTLAGIGKRLTDRLGMHVEPWRLPAEHAADAELMPPACLLGAAIGLSAAAWEAP
jgi:Tfp pilus assembly PilM family ATPase